MQLYWMRQAGLNISGFCSTKDLARVHAAGLACFVSDPRANGYDWKQMPSPQILQKKIDSLVRQVQGQPAALGFFLRDEPDASLMPGLGQAATLLKRAMPNAWPYINLLPNYTPAARLGAANYEVYLKQYIQQVHPSLLSYDNYSLFDGEMLGRFYSNLETIRDLSLANKIPFWNVILSNSHFTYMEPNDATLHLQAYSTMAYGGRGIEYYTYFSPAAGNFRMAAVDQFGQRTPTWGELRRLNSEIRELAPWLAQLRSTGVYHSDPLPEGAKPIAQSTLVKDVRASTYESPPVPPRYLIGEFAGPNGRPFLMLVNKDLKHSFRYVIELKQSGKRLLLISPYSGKEESPEAEMDWLAPGAGALFEIK